MAAEVSNQGADPQTAHLLALDSLNQPFVDVQLLNPLLFVLHDCPCRGELVIRDDDPVRGLLLEVNLPTDLYPIHFVEQALLHHPAIRSAPLHDHMQSRAKQLPQHI